MPATIYHAIIISIMLMLAYKFEHHHSKLTYLLLVLFVAIMYSIRYDTTADYANYVRIFLNKENSLIRVEPGYLTLNKLFSFWDYGYLLVFALSTLFCYWTFLRFLKKQDLLFWGIFFGTTLFLFQMFNNQIRQSIALGIFTISIKYLLEKNPFKYTLLIITASLFHFSAILLLFFYPATTLLHRRRYSPFLMAAVLLAFYVLYLTGVFAAFSIKIYSLFPQYALYETVLGGNKAELGTGLGILFTVSTTIFLSFYSKKFKDEELIFLNTTVLVTILFLVTNDFPILSRFFRYFLIFKIAAFAILMKRALPKLYKSLLLILFLIYGVKSYYQYYSGANFKTIFHQDCKNHVFLRYKNGEGGQGNSERTVREIIK